MWQSLSASTPPPRGSLLDIESENFLFFSFFALSVGDDALSNHHFPSPFLLCCFTHNCPRSNWPLSFSLINLTFGCEMAATIWFKYAIFFKGTFDYAFAPFVVDWSDADVIVPKIARIVGGGPPKLCLSRKLSANEGARYRVWWGDY